MPLSGSNDLLAYSFIGLGNLLQIYHTAFLRKSNRTVEKHFRLFVECLKYDFVKLIAVALSASEMFLGDFIFVSRYCHI